MKYIFFHWILQPVSPAGFGGDSAHLSHLNSYIMEAHNKFKRYFSQICDVEDPEMMFNMDQYTDVTRVTKPVIYISIGECPSNIYW